MIDQFTISKTKKTLKYQRRTISERLVEDKTQSLLQNALGNPLKESRIEAINLLGRYANTSFEVEVLRRLSETEPDLELRRIATDAMNSIIKRLQ